MVFAFFPFLCRAFHYVWAARSSSHYVVYAVFLSVIIRIFIPGLFNDALVSLNGSK